MAGQPTLAVHISLTLRPKSVYSNLAEELLNIMTVVKHAKFAPDQHPDADRVPTRGLQAHHLRPSFNQLHQAFLLSGGQLGRSSTPMVIDQAVQTVQQKGLLPSIKTGWAEAPALAYHRNWGVVYQQVNQDRGPPHQPDIVLLVGLLKTAIEGFDGAATELYPNAHGCILLWGCLASVL